MRFDKTISANRITEMLSIKGIKQKDLANSLGIKSANIVSYWTSQKENYRQPSLEQFAAMADYFNVSVDYLMGLSDYPQRGMSLADELGLSSKAVNRLSSIANDPKQKVVLSTILESEELFALIRKVLLAQELEGSVEVGKLF